MSTQEARTRANKAWRERTGKKLVQAYLHTDVIARLDKLVEERGAKGRAAVLAELIEQAVQPAPPQSAPAPALKVIDRQADTDQCECATSTGGRCRNATVAIIKAVVNGQLGEYGTCKRHIRVFQPYSEA
jgi:hypothetical protein